MKFSRTKNIITKKFGIPDLEGVLAFDKVLQGIITKRGYPRSTRNASAKCLKVQSKLYDFR